MSSPTHRASQIKRDRRGIIATLAMIYPGAMPGEELFRIILDRNPAYERTLMVKDCYYLRERGYLEFLDSRGRVAERMSVADCLFRLTAAGTDVGNEIARDPMLEI